MAWTVIVILDPDKPGVGQGIAVWNKGLSDEFTFTARVESGQAGQFVSAAKAAQTADALKKSREATLSTSLTNALNS
jgi:hypothetical protein